MDIKSMIFKCFIKVSICFALFLTFLPNELVNVIAQEEPYTKTSDLSTMDEWQNYYPITGNLTTENAGSVWTDKTVTSEEKTNFKVTLSAIASNMTVTGKSSIPTDTVLVLDVSGSMTNHASQLVDAANNTIDSLLNSNERNRVGVVLYSGPNQVGSSTGINDAVTILPLGRYTTVSNHYLRLNNGAITLYNAVENEETSTKPNSISKRVNGGTYIQTGIHLAMNQFLNAYENTVQRKPVFVLMSDGAPTLATTVFTNPKQSQMGDGQSRNTNAAQGFVTQLSMAFAKQQIEEIYNTTALFYTLGVGLTSNTEGYQVARSVLNPSGNYTDTFANEMRSLWIDYMSAYVNDAIVVQGRGSNALRVTKISQTLEQNFVDRYFTTDRAEDMIHAFQQILTDISLQSAYYPTLVEEDENHSGYITMSDTIGQYMKVKEIYGLQLGNKVYSGKELARSINQNGQDLGTIENPTRLGYELFQTFQTRIGLSSVEDAQEIIELAYSNGQLRYTNETEYSNYVGWFANQNGEYLGFWHEGISNIPTSAKYIVKTYGYLGNTDETQGTKKTDMMYVIVHVHEDIQTQKQQVTFAIPATLIPTITYKVSLNDSKTFTNLDVEGAKNLIRLSYRVGVNEEINSFNVKEKISNRYLNEHLNQNGSISFYTNQYDINSTTGFNQGNTISSFQPSYENDRYYYQNQSFVYTDTNGSLYRGTTQPAGKMYHADTIYTNRGMIKKYYPLSLDTLETTLQTQEETWYIPKNNVRKDYDNHLKSNNLTDTLSFVNKPFIVAKGNNSKDTDHHFVYGTTLGNNGQLSFISETGIKLTKTLEEGFTSKSQFTFELENITLTNDSTNYPAYKINEDATTTTQVKFTNGKATVQLRANEILYIGGMNKGNTIKISEVESVEYMTDKPSQKITIEANTLKPVAFVNRERGIGNLTIVKEVKHNFGEDYIIPSDKVFTIHVTFDGIGTSNQTFLAKHSNIQAITNIQTDELGQVKSPIYLKHGEQIEIIGLPDGTLVQVIEKTPPTGFTPRYWVNGGLSDGRMTIEKNQNSSIIVVNDYEANEISPLNINLSGTKKLEDRHNWTNQDVYKIILEEYEPENQSWSVLDSKIVDKENQKFNFSDVFKTIKYIKPGNYIYQIKEEIGNVPGVLYDTVSHAFMISVTDDNMDGQLEINHVTPIHNDTDVVKEENAYFITTDFTNIYEKETTKATILIQKEILNESNSPFATQDGFIFEIYDETGKTKIATSQPTSMTGMTKLDLHYSEEGIYHYLVKEINQKKTGWTYSNEMKKVSVVVKDDTEGHLIAKAYVVDEFTTELNGNETNTALVELSYTNQYIPTNAELSLNFVNKKLIGRSMKNGEFTFKIVADEEMKIVAIGKNDSQGNVIFDNPLLFSKIGEYFYSIVETTSDGNGIESDKSVYRMKVTVSDQEGKLNAKKELLNINDDEITFVNNYQVKSVAHSITGTKVLVDKTMLDQQFTFILTLDDEIIATAKNNKTGTFSFPSITYNKAGQYSYQVYEQIPSDKEGIKYDSTVFQIQIEVKDNNKGELVIDKVVIIKDKKEVEMIQFTNIYSVKEATFNISGKKNLVNRALKEGEFDFLMYPTDERFLINSNVQPLKTTNNADGTFTFNAITFNEVKKYYFVIREDNTVDVKGITFDSTVYQIIVDVADDGKGQLEVKDMILLDGNNDVLAIEFINIYKKPITPTTSDSINIEMWFALFMISGTMTLLIFLDRKKNSKE